MIFAVKGYIEMKEARHGDTMAIKSLLPRFHTFIYSRNYINIGDTMVKIKKICEGCGNVFISAAKRFCSRKCYEEWRQSLKITRICKQCGKKINTRGARIFCSHECCVEWRRTNTNWRGTRIKRVCKQCNKIFFAKKSEIRKGGGKFCSRKCYDEWQSKDINVFERLKKMRQSITKPTKPELIFEQICKRNNIDFHYTGNGSLWIGKKGEKQLNPDFIEANGKKICVEIMGAYWHSPLLNKNLRKDSFQFYREKHYRRYKWIPIFIWDTDLLREDSEEFVLSVMKKEGII